MTNAADVAVIYGTRPEVIKLSPLVRALRETTSVSVLTVSTHQHASLLDDALSASHLVTDVETPRPDGADIQSLVSSIGLNLQRMNLETRAVVVQGDTITAYAGAMFGFLSGMSVIHVEAGLRTSTLTNPFPEEGLRRAISQLSDLHLAPTQLARANLEREGINSRSIVITGNTSIDALIKQLESHSPPIPNLPDLQDAYCVVTLHRRESWGPAIARVAEAIGQLAKLFPTVDFVCPLHPNPRVQKEFSAIGRQENVLVIDPVPHDEFVSLLRRARMIITDSGGIQEEATVLGIPTLVAREETERPEAVTAGVAHIVGTDINTIVDSGSRILTTNPDMQLVVSARDTFGDGHAGHRCARAIEDYLEGRTLPPDMAKVDF